MDEKKLRELFMERLHLEIQIFKDSMMCKSKEEIFAESYMIELYINLYEILLQQSERIPAQLLRKLLYQRSGILDAFYQEWLSMDDSFFTELKEYVENEFDILSAVKEVINGKGDEDGEERNKAA